MLSGSCEGRKPEYPLVRTISGDTDDSDPRDYMRLDSCVKLRKFM